MRTRTKSVAVLDCMGEYVDRHLHPGRMPRPKQLLGGLLLASAASAAVAAKGDLLDLVWSHDGSFSREVQVLPGRFVEACGQLPSNIRVEWRFQAGAAMDFNVHFHEGKDVRYPVRQDALARAEGTLDTPVAQDYCWMWTNRSAARATLSFTLRRR